jgi:hypothetical protein
MVRVLLAAAIMVGLLGSSAFSIDYIGFYTDTQRGGCEVSDQQLAVPVDVHMFHEGVGSTRGSLFYAPFPPCLHALWLGDFVASPFQSVGTTTNSAGIGIDYLVCLDLPVYLGYVRLLQTSPPSGSFCCHYGAQPADGESAIVALNCDLTEREGFTSVRVSFGALYTGCCLCCVAVESSTWGQVKALYR